MLKNKLMLVFIVLSLESAKPYALAKENINLNTPKIIRTKKMPRKPKSLNAKIAPLSIQNSQTEPEVIPQIHTPITPSLQEKISKMLANEFLQDRQETPHVGGPA